MTRYYSQLNQPHLHRGAAVPQHSEADTLHMLLTNLPKVSYFLDHVQSKMAEVQLARGLSSIAIEDEEEDVAATNPLEELEERIVGRLERVLSDIIVSSVFECLQRARSGHNLEMM